MSELSEENKRFIQSKGLNPSRWFVIWEDYEVLEVINRRGQRRVLKKSKCQ